MIKRFEHGCIMSYKNSRGIVVVMNIYTCKLNGKHEQATGVIAAPEYKPIGYDIISWWQDE